MCTRKDGHFFPKRANIRQPERFISYQSSPTVLALCALLAIQPPSVVPRAYAPCFWHFCQVRFLMVNSAFPTARMFRRFLRTRQPSRVPVLLRTIVISEPTASAFCVPCGYCILVGQGDLGGTGFLLSQRTSLLPPDPFLREVQPAEKRERQQNRPAVHEQHPRLSAALFPRHVYDLLRRFFLIRP